MDIIHIDNLIFSGKHGVYEKERNLEQEFEVSVVLSFDVSRAALSDKISDTIDYSEAKKAVRGVIEGSSCYLIEKLARDIADKLLGDTRIESVKVTVRKIHVWDNGIPGVTITRGRK